MESKTYHAETMAEALTMVKRDLGRDAVILHTRPFRKGGFLGLGGRRLWEVTASANVNVPSRLAGQYVSQVPQQEQPPPVAAPLPVAQDVFPASGLGEKMLEIHQMVARLLSRNEKAIASSLPPALQEVQSHLLHQDVAEWMVDELLAELGSEELPVDHALLMSKLADMVAARMPAAPLDIAPSQSGRPCLIALIGPTGVGKTTTIAKLSARFKLSEKKKVGLITIDTYRIAAVDQLKIYAQIIDIPLKTVLTPIQMQEAVAALAGMDVVLIDTAGRSQNDRLRLNQLRGFLVAAQPEQVHLVMSATSSRTTATRIIENFMPLGANRLIMTKLDEADSFGMILNVAATSKVALSYVTTGQEVPDDIAAADPRHLANIIVGEGAYVS